MSLFRRPVSFAIKKKDLVGRSSLASDSFFFAKRKGPVINGLVGWGNPPRTGFRDKSRFRRAPLVFVA